MAFTAVDISNFSGKITEEQAKGLRDSNRRLIVGCQDVDIAAHNVKVARANCLEVQLYAMFYSSVPIARELDKAKTVVDMAMRDDPMPFLWLDFEDAVPVGASWDMVLGWIHRVVITAQEDDYLWAPDELGIYTREGWWKPATGNSNEFQWMPLWNALYDDKPDLEVFNPYGGWERQTMKQYAADRPVWGINTDWNVYA